MNLLYARLKRNQSEMKQEIVQSSMTNLMVEVWKLGF